MSLMRGCIAFVAVNVISVASLFVLWCIVGSESGMEKRDVSPSIGSTMRMTIVIASGMLMLPTPSLYSLPSI